MKYITVKWTDDSGTLNQAIGQYNEQEMTDGEALTKLLGDSMFDNPPYRGPYGVQFSHIIDGDLVVEL